MEFEAPPPRNVDEALADLSVRFLANLPVKEPPTVERLFFQIQQAHWYYLDFYVGSSERPPTPKLRRALTKNSADEYGGTEDLPHLSGWDFTRLLFERCPLLQHYGDRFSGFIQKFKEYTWHSTSLSLPVIKPFVDPSVPFSPGAVPVFGAILLNASMTRVLLVRSFRGKSWGFPRARSTRASRTRTARRARSRCARARDGGVH